MKEKPTALRMTSRADGSARMVASGKTILAGVALILLLFSLIVAPERHLVIAGIVGAVIAASMALFVWALVDGRLKWNELWNKSEFTAVRKKDGTLDFQGIDNAAWPLAILLAILLTWLFAPEAVWMMWTTLGGCILASVLIWLVTATRSKKQDKGPVKGQ